MDEEDVSKEVLSVRVDDPPLTVGGVAPAVLAAVIIGVLLGIALLFSMAIFMDRRNRRFATGRSAQRSLAHSARITILDDASPNPISEPPAAQVAGSRTSSDC